MLKETIKINNKTALNRLVMPPMVIYEYNTTDGMVSNATVEHYRHYAKQKIGLIVVEATCISEEGRLDMQQLGLWCDDQIEGHKKIAKAIKDEGVIALIQIHHGGLRAMPCRFSLTNDEPTDELKKAIGLVTGGKSPARANTAISSEEDEVYNPILLTTEKLDSIKEEFIKACERAYKAGYDGVELHGAHGYLISNLLNDKINTRTDKYGTDVKGRASFASDIMKKVRLICGNEFIINIRMGGNDNDSVEYAKIFEEAGANGLNVSYGTLAKTDETPEGYEGEAIWLHAKKVKDAVKIPVIGIFKVIDATKVEFILNNGLADMVAVGRSVLSDNYWFDSILAGKVAGRCYWCKGCKWHAGLSQECPGVIKRKNK